MAATSTVASPPPVTPPSFAPVRTVRLSRIYRRAGRRRGSERPTTTGQLGGHRHYLCPPGWRWPARPTTVLLPRLSPTADNPPPPFVPNSASGYRDIGRAGQLDRRHGSRGHQRGGRRAPPLSGRHRACGGHSTGDASLRPYHTRCGGRGRRPRWPPTRLDGEEATPAALATATAIALAAPLLSTLPSNPPPPFAHNPLSLSTE